MEIRAASPPTTTRSKSPTAYHLSGMKFGRIKRQHGRVGGLDEILNFIIKNCPHVSRIVPGRIKVRRGKTPANLRFSIRPIPA